MWRAWRNRHYLPHWRRAHHHIRVLLTIGALTIELIPERTILMATTIKAGQTLPMTLKYTDTAGNVTTTFKTDSPAQWADTTPTADTLSADADGNSAEALGLPAGGDDTINVTVMAGGVPFTASLALTVEPEVVVRTLAKVEIVPGTPTP